MAEMARRLKKGKGFDTGRLILTESPREGNKELLTISVFHFSFNNIFKWWTGLLEGNFERLVGFRCLFLFHAMERSKETLFVNHSIDDNDHVLRTIELFVIVSDGLS